MTAPGQSERLPLDVRATRATARLRALGAVIVIPAAAAVAYDGGTVRWTIAVLAWIASLAWIGSALVARRRLDDADRHFLELRPDSLLLSRGDALLTIPWASVTGVEVDEETLGVRVELRDQAPLTLEPIWGGLGAYDLCARVERAWDGASWSEGG